MVYEWKCSACEERVEITRPAVDYDKEPDFPTCCAGAPWAKVISIPHYDMEHMFDKGIFERVERFPIRGM